MRHRPAFYTLTRLATRTKLRNEGYSRNQINSMIDAAADDVVDLASADVPVPAEVAVGTVGAIGDGTIIQAIIDFLKSEQGQQLIAALIKILLSLIAV